MKQLFENLFLLLLAGLLGSALPLAAQDPDSVGNDPGDPIEYEMTIVETTYRSAKLSWTDIETWSDPWLIQRSTTPSFVDPTDLTNNQAADNTGSGTYRILGINADNYTDLDGLAEATTYYYRVGVCKNLSDHYQNGVTPAYGTWIYGEATTGTLAARKKLTYDVTQSPYNADDTGATNAYAAIQSALDDAEAAGGGIVYLPKGTYKIYPTDRDITDVDGIPTADRRDRFISQLFTIQSDNITLLGAGAGKTTLNLRLWNDHPMTEWMQVVDRRGVVTNIRRYSLISFTPVQNFTLKDMTINGGATPVNTGHLWQGVDAKKYQWDITHKLITTYGNATATKNCVIEGITTYDWRGEVFFLGGAGQEKWLIKDCDIRRTNSSSVSTSADLEIVNTTIADSANAALESAINATKQSQFGAYKVTQNHIARGLTIIGMDQSENGYMKDLPGNKKRTFGGWLCFNDEGTYQSVSDTSFADNIWGAFAPLYEYRNGMRYNCVFEDRIGSGGLIYTQTQPKAAYGLDGGMSEILWMGDTINMTRDWHWAWPWCYSQPGKAALGNQSPWIWEAVQFNGIGGTWELGRLWLDIWALPSGRQNVVWKDWTLNNVTLSNLPIQPINPDKNISPVYINVPWQ
jgi:flagellin-like hook-associated protein FlgL